MISVDQARQIIFEQNRVFPSEKVLLSQAFGRVLRQDIVNDRDQPPFNKSTMDGVLINSCDLREGNAHFKIAGTIAAGIRPPKNRIVKNSCYKIMTGAAVAEGFDTVVPIELVKIQDGYASIIDGSNIAAGWNIRFKGSDSPQGKVLVGSGMVLESVHVACAASTGQSHLKVTKIPRIAIISTGNELVPVNRKQILPYQIRLSNSWAIDAILNKGPWGIAKLFHVKDDPDVLYKKLKKILSEFEILILSGGVSKGDFDYVPQILKRLGVDCLFHEVSQKPGKPLWFGRNNKGSTVFALPGNPVSTLVCAYVYVLPFLQSCAGGIPKKKYVMLKVDALAESSLTRFLPVTVVENSQDHFAQVQLSGGSGDFASLSSCSGFVEVPAGKLKQSSRLRVAFYEW